MTCKGMQVVAWQTVSDVIPWDDLLFAWLVCKHVISNAIVLAENGQRRSAIGAGRLAGWTPVRIALPPQKSHGSLHDPSGSLLASYAFLPIRPTGTAASR